MMNEVDVENLTIEQYLMLTQENQAHGMARTKYGMTITKDIENMTIAEYMEYEAEIKRDPWGYAQSYTRSSGSTTLERKKDLNHFNLFAPNSHHEDEEVSSDKDVDKWLNTEMIKRMTRSFYKKAQIKAPSSKTSKIQGISFVTEEEEEDSSETLPCQLPPKEINPGRAGVNVMPKSLFEHLKLANLKETSMVFEMGNIPRKAPLGIVENILVKIDKFLFHSDFVVIDMLEGLNETMLLGRPFLATIHAQIDVFRREILLGIGEEKVKFDMNGGICHSRVPFKNICMASAVQENENFNPLEIENDVFSYDSPTCLLLEQGTPSCSDESIDTVDSSDDMQELEGSQDDEVGSHLLENVVSRWHVYKPIHISFVDCKKDCGQWPTCNPDLSFCSGYDAIYEQEKIRYGNKNIDDVTREQRYYEWITYNYDFNVKSRRATEYADPYDFHHEYPHSYIPQKSDSSPNDTLRINTYFPDVFQTQLKKPRLLGIIHLGNEGKDMPWMKYGRNEKLRRVWYDKGFEEEELWQNGIEEIDYTPLLVKSETFEVHRYTFKNRKSFISITKQMDDVLTLGRVDGSRFMEKTRKEMDEEKRTTRKT
ncbi:copia protein [Tanacetum coccineum]